MNTIEYQSIARTGNLIQEMLDHALPEPIVTRHLTVMLASAVVLYGALTDESLSKIFPLLTMPQGSAKLFQMAEAVGDASLFEKAHRNTLARIQRDLKYFAVKSPQHLSEIIAPLLDFTDELDQLSTGRCYCRKEQLCQ
jgi:hypothetical protein